MMPTPTEITFGYNIHPEALNDPNRSSAPKKLWDHIDKIKHKRGGHVVLRNLDYSIDLARRHPKSIVLIRYWPDEDNHIKLKWDDKLKRMGPNPNYKTPLQWIDMVEKDWLKCKAAGVTNVAFYFMNESGDPDAMVAWCTRMGPDGKDTNREKGILDLAAERGIPLSGPHLAIGAWERPQLEKLKPIFQKISKHDALFALGFHEYFTLLPSSGMPIVDDKGDPEFVILDSAWSSSDAKKKWVEQGKPYFPVQPENWPRDPDMARYHAGRNHLVDDICDDSGIPRLRKHISEAGTDRLDEGGGGFVAAWLGSAKRPKEFLDIRFWRSCVDQWAIWFKNWSAQRAYWEMLLYLLLFVWMSPYKGKSRRIEMVAIFSWWSSGEIGTAQDWNPNRVDNADEFLLLHENHANAVPEQPAEPIIKPDDPRLKPRKVIVAQGHSPLPVYAKPDKSTKVIGELGEGSDRVTHIPHSELTPAEQLYVRKEVTYLVITRNSQIGFVDSTKVQLVEPPVVTERKLAQLGTSIINIRSGPGTNFNDIGDLINCDEIYLYPDKKSDGDGLEWLHILRPGYSEGSNVQPTVEGWVRANLISRLRSVPTGDGVPSDSVIITKKRLAQLVAAETKAAELATELAEAKTTVEALNQTVKTLPSAIISALHQEVEHHVNNQLMPVTTVINDLAEDLAN